MGSAPIIVLLLIALSLTQLLPRRHESTTGERVDLFDLE